MACQKCHKNKFIKYGTVWSGGKRVQRYICNVCGRTTIIAPNRK
jgi:protein-arginine kinase activator protein McsA